MSKIHHREKIVEKAKLKLMGCFAEIGGDLTDGELVRVVAESIGEQLGLIAKYMIRAERHPKDPDKPGGLE